MRAATELIAEIRMKERTERVEVSRIVTASYLF